MACSSFLQAQLAELTAAVQKSFSSPHLWQQRIYVSSSGRLYEKSGLLNRLFILIDKIWRLLTFKKSSSVTQNLEKKIYPLFDQTISQSYFARLQHLLYKIGQIEKRFFLNNGLQEKEQQQQKLFFQLQEELGEAATCLKSWQEKLQTSLASKKLQEKKITSFKRSLAKTIQALFPFWQQMLCYQHTFASLLSAEPSTKIGASASSLLKGAISSRSLYQALEREESWMALEHVLQQPIPFIELIKICQPQTPLDPREKKRLCSWVEQLNRLIKKKSFSNRKQKIFDWFKLALKEVALVASLEGTFLVTEALLVNRLSDYDCQLTQLKERSHLSWRSQLHPGQELKCRGAIYQLGEELQSAKKASLTGWQRSQAECKDQRRTFLVASHPDLVIQVGQNPFDLAIAEEETQVYQFGIGQIASQPPVETEDGYLISINERMTESLSNYHFSSTSYPLNAQDQRWAFRLASFLLCMYDWQVWPNSIDKERLYLDKKGVLRTTQLLDLGQKIGQKIGQKKKGESGLDRYLAAEAFCTTFKGTGDKKDLIVRYLMEVSGYSQHALAQFYRNEVVKFLKTGQLEELEVVLPHGYFQPIYKQRLQQLFKQSKKIKKRTLYALFDWLEQKKLVLTKERSRLKAQQEALQKLPLKAGTEELLRYQHQLQELKLAKQALAQKEQLSQENFYKERLAFIRSWRHFSSQEWLTKLERLQKELVQIEIEIKKAKQPARRKSHDVRFDISAPSKSEQLLLQKQGQLFMKLQEYERSIIKRTLCDRLLTLYLQSATAATLDDSLIETLVESFKKSSSWQAEPVTSATYFQQQRALLLAKNKAAITQPPVS